VNPFVARPVTAARVAAAVEGSLAVASGPPVPLPVRPEPAAAPAAEAPPAPSAHPGALEELRRALDEEVSAGAPALADEMIVDEPSGSQPIARLSARPGAARGRTAGRPSDGEGAMALASFTEPAVAPPRPARAARAEGAEAPVPEAIREFEAPAPAPSKGSRRNVLLALGGVALVAAVAAGLGVARRGPAPPTRLEEPAQAPVPDAPAPAVPAPAPRAEPPSPGTAAVAAPAPREAPAPEAKPTEGAEAVASRKAARARKADAEGAPRPLPAGAEAPRAPVLEGAEPSSAPAPAASRPAPAAARAAPDPDAAPRPAAARPLPAPAPAAPAAAEPVREPAPDAPRYVGTGFRPPRLAQADCLSENLRLASHLAAMVTGPLTVKFAVYPDGRVEQLQVMNKLPDPRIGEAVVRAVRACEWVPGADADGTPAPLWVVQPIRLAL
jgi:hypothetical protein